jgi:signal transduction histidine kinase
MFFGGNNGFNIFNPDSIRDFTYRPTVIITTLRRFNKDNVSGVPIEENLLAKDSVSLSYQDNMLNIEFVSLSLSKPQKNQFAYRLIGLSDQWYQLGTKREISLTGLTPGKYILEVKGSNGDGVWNENPDTLHITILPPWWRTWWAYTLYAIIFIAGVFAFIRYRSRSLKAQNIRLEHKVAIRTNELKQSLENLKSTQAQLIQSEKMASLGELTAGIAHEIQNPLNFVNNFSEVNTELIEDLEQEANKGNLNEVKTIVKDIKENELKINHHGKRADSIVKNMLQHSRVGSGQKELTNINGLADEYLKLAYHGMRAKDKSFNATLQTDFDPSIGKINIVAQDIGRVLLNLYNNAFYALNEKQKQNIPGYEPTIALSTKKIGNKISINVKDNGNGISQNVLDKIFQPFFTTKPTAQGTGLGLSLAYDIVKSHGGEIKVETQEGEGSKFVVELPAL